MQLSFALYFIRNTMATLVTSDCYQNTYFKVLSQRHWSSKMCVCGMSSECVGTVCRTLPLVWNSTCRLFSLMLLIALPLLWVQWIVHTGVGYILHIKYIGLTITKHNPKRNILVGSSYRLFSLNYLLYFLIKIIQEKQSITASNQNVSFWIVSFGSETKVFYMCRIHPTQYEQFITPML